MFRIDEPAQRPPEKKSPRRTAIRGAILLVLAVVAAVGAAALLTRYMDARTAAARVPTERVVVAAVDIPVATPIKAEWLATVEWPMTSRPTGAAASPQEIAGRVATRHIVKGEAVLASTLASEGARSGLATLLPEGMRAAAVRVDDVVGVAGFLHPGDLVDVIATMQPAQSAPFTSKVILQGVKVLAVGKDLERRQGDLDKAVPATVATLLVTSEESERLALAATKGQIMLTLRGLGDDELVATAGVAPPQLFSYTEPRREPDAPKVQRVVVRTAPPPPPKPKEKQVVEILRGDLFEKRDFDKQVAR